MNSSLWLLTNTLVTFLNIYMVLMLIRILLSWFPNVNWYDPPFSILSQLTDPYLNLFRSFIPPLGGIDFSAIIAIFVLQIAAQLIVGFLGGMQTTMF
ncbi:MAG: YggT family protein [Okeania sp. SIO2H7]|nr:YggT family protein [Okeania sp. SIO2H7]